MNPKTWLSRRNVLRGLGVSLALPWLESLAPPRARAQTAARPIKRYLLMYFPCGVARRFWPPDGAGAGDAWTLSALLEPLLPYKQYLQVISNGGQEALYNAGVNPNPSHSLYCAPSFSCTVPNEELPILGGPTVDQILAPQIATPENSFESLQLGCSTMNSNPDGRHPAITRSISWKTTDQPLYKEVNPQTVFDRLVAQLTPSGELTPEAAAAAELRKARRLSALDYVIQDANALSAKLSKSDRARLEQFLSSVRDKETRVRQLGSSMVDPGKTYVRPTLSATYTERQPGSELEAEGDYDRNEHAEVMNDLIMMAFETNQTNVISHMLDDARSEYHYKFLKQRTFSGSTSSENDVPLTTVQQGDLLGYHGLSHDGDDNHGFATVNHWFVQKLASLLQRMTTAPEGGGPTILDDTLVLFMSGMQGSGHQLTELPIVLATSGKVFKADYHNDFPDQVPLANIHLTIMQKAFALDVPQLGYSTGIVDGLLV
jgi:hypothetical protein